MLKKTLSVNFFYHFKFTLNIIEINPFQKYICGLLCSEKKDGHFIAIKIIRKYCEIIPVIHLKKLQLYKKHFLIWLLKGFFKLFKNFSFNILITTECQYLLKIASLHINNFVTFLANRTKSFQK